MSSPVGASGTTALAVANPWAVVPSLGNLDAYISAVNRLSDVTGTNACTREDFRIALDLLAGGQLRAGPLVSHRFPLREIERAFETTRSGEGLRVVVEP